MVDVATMRELDPEQFSQAGDGYHSVRSMADEAKSRVGEGIVPKMDADLRGEAATAAATSLRGLTANFHYMQTECGLAHAALNALTAELRAAKKKFDTAQEEAETAGFTVHLDGSVTYPAAGEKVDGKQPDGGTVTGNSRGAPSGRLIDPATDADSAADAIRRQADNASPNPHYGAAVDIADRIAEALQEATEADEKWARKLRGLKADDDLHVSRKDWLGVRDDMRGIRKGAGDYLKPPEDRSPAANARWWKNLSEDEQDDYISLHPASIGAMDGLPADARDEANRTVMTETKAGYELERAAMPAEPKKYTWINTYEGKVKVPSKEWIAWNAEYGERKKHLDSTLNGIEAVQDRFDRTGDRGLPEACLLGFAPKGEGDGKIILANGDPDGAAHTAVHVPGTGTSLGGIDGNLDQNDKLWRNSARLAPGESVSTITWFDYDAPDSIPQATQSGWAEDGGPRLQRFLEGTEAAQGGPHSSHTTVSGHSYGSTVVGEAAKHHELPADDVMVEGSPGMQVEHARDLGVGADHVWALGADWTWDDAIVRHGGRMMGLGEDSMIPTDDGFGANVMDYGEYRGFSGHGGFWDEEGNKPSTSLLNMASVVVGQGEQVELD
ncbi:alpha/beta hydrolase [Streptomyces sulphureus]|uniref:alpha/beta hydrolase n=1 Tax=Streptomyces sulphureus TaxID=47758 RepID=UPI00037FFB42|nr:alpha/beta hydrolase [Streptomyces sulphureus]